MCLDTFLTISKGNNLISKLRAFHNVGAAYTKDLSKYELAHVLLIGGIHNTFEEKIHKRLHTPSKYKF